MATQSLPQHTHHGAPKNEAPAAVKATGIVVALTVAVLTCCAVPGVVLIVVAGLRRRA